MVDLIIRLNSQSIDEVTEACLDKTAMAFININANIRTQKNFARNIWWVEPVEMLNAVKDILECANGLKAMKDARETKNVTIFM